MIDNFNVTSWVYENCYKKQPVFSLKDGPFFSVNNVFAHFTDKMRQEMKGWLIECGWDEDELDEEYSDKDLIRTVKYEFDGGLKHFFECSNLTLPE